jgi:hypothetical protein
MESGMTGKRKHAAMYATESENQDLGLLLRYVENVNRVADLIRLYESHPGSQGRGRKKVEPTDILRASVVLLHATFEDMCRTIERELLPFASQDVLKRIPLLGMSGHRSPRKFSLGDLARHRGKTINDIIKGSIEAHLQHRSYNNADDFRAFLARVGFRRPPFEPYFSGIGSLTKRRHDIVHQVDRNEGFGCGHQQVKSLSKNTVRSWVKCVHRICIELERQYRNRRSDTEQ